jgi:SO2946-like, C-terminal domain
MSLSICVPGPVIVPFTQQDPPKSEAIQTAVNLILGGFEKHRKSIDCTNDRIDQLISGGASLLTSLNSGSRIGPRPNLNFIEGVNVTIQLSDDAINDEFDLTIAVPGLSSAVTNGANVGTGGATGFVFRDKTGTTLNFRSLNPLSPLLGLTFGDQVLIAAITVPAGAPELVGSTRVINGTSPIRINGGASSNLQSDITVSYRFNPRTKTEFLEEFIGLQAFTGFCSCQNTWDIGFVGAGGGVFAKAAESNHPGIINLRSKTVAAALVVNDGVWTICAENGSNILLQGGWDVELGIRITYTTEFGVNGNSVVTRAGWGDQGGTADFVDGVYFEYNPAVSANWFRCTSSNSVRTKTDTGVAATNNFVAFRFVVNAAATSIEFFIDGTSVGSNTTNIPTAAGRELAPEIQQQVTVAVANASQLIFVDVDYFWMENSSLSR